MISVLMITYNHEKFIAEAIQNVLSQNTDFPVHLFIGDDASPDNTSGIVEDFVKKFPDCITYIKHQKNVGMQQNFIHLFSLVNTKYIALCEGDDYWCDENKLQKQVDFLESNNDYAICYHRVPELKNGKLLPDEMNSAEIEMTYTIEDLAEKNFMHTPSVVFRSTLIKSFPEWYKNSPAGDYVLHMLNAKHGLIKYFPQPMAVYRRHENSVWSAMPELRRIEGWLSVLSYLVSEFEANEKVKDILQKQAIHGFKFYYKKYIAENKRSGLNFDSLDNTTKSMLQKMPVFAAWWFDDIYQKQVLLARSYPWGIKKSTSHFIGQLKKRLKA